MQTTATEQKFDVAAFLEARKLNPFTIRLIVISWLITFFDGLDMMMISYTAPYMAEDLLLSRPQLGNIFSCGLLGMMLGGFFFAYLGDRLGRRNTIIFSTFSFGILTAATAFAGNYTQLLTLRFLDGFAIGGMLPLCWALNIEYAPKRNRSTIITIIMMGYSMGAALAGPLTNLVAPRYGWPGVFVVGGAGTLVSAFLLLIMLPESIRFLVSKQMKREQVVRLLYKLAPNVSLPSLPRFYLGDEPIIEENFHIRQLFSHRLALLTPLLWLAYIASTLSVYLMANWGPIVLEAVNIARHTAATASAIGSVAGAIAGLCLMRFTDRFGPYAVAFLPVLATLSLLFIGLKPLPEVVFLWMSVIASALVSGAHFGIISIAGIFYPSAIRANGAGWATSIAKFGGIAGPILGGLFLASDAPVIHIFAFLAICPIILAVCAFAMGLVARKTA